MNDRGMKKWMPYKSLEDQSDFLAQMQYEKRKMPRPTLLDEEIYKINAILTSNHQKPVILKYYNDGYVYEMRGRITYVDSVYKYIKISETRIDFRDIVKIEELD